MFACAQGALADARDRMCTPKRELIHEVLEDLAACSLKVIDCLKASLLAVPLEQYGRLLQKHSAVRDIVRARRRSLEEHGFCPRRSRRVFGSQR